MGLGFRISDWINEDYKDLPRRQEGQKRLRIVDDVAMLCGPELRLPNVLKPALLGLGWGGFRI